MAKHYLGIDVGGTGTKAAIIDVKNGELVTEKLRLPTPTPAKPGPLVKVMQQLIDDLDYSGKIGVGFPSSIHNKVATSAANIDDEWIGVEVEEFFSDQFGETVYVANDADVAGLAEVKFGAAKDVEGVVLVLTIGTGIGSALFLDGELVPNTELGHLNYNGAPFEDWASKRARKRDDLTYEEWGERFNVYLQHVEMLFSPDLFVLGGGSSKKYDQYKDKLTVDTPITTAEFKNDAGVLGAGMFARSRHKRSKKKKK